MSEYLDNNFLDDEAGMLYCSQNPAQYESGSGQSTHSESYNSKDDILPEEYSTNKPYLVTIRAKIING